MSLGDSLLDYYTEEEIRANVVDVYDYIEDKTFVLASFADIILGGPYFLKRYEVIQVEFKDKDKDYKIYGLTGKLISIYEINFEACYTKQDEIVKEIHSILENEIEVSHEPIIGEHPADTTGRSTVRQFAFELKNGNILTLDCNFWHQSMPYANNLHVAFGTQELEDWLTSTR